MCVCVLTKKELTVDLLLMEILFCAGVEEEILSLSSSSSPSPLALHSAVVVTWITKIVYNFTSVGMGKYSLSTPVTDRFIPN